MCHTSFKVKKPNYLEEIEMKFIKDAGLYLTFVAMIWAITYMMVYAWDAEYEYQQQKEKEYYENIYRG